MVSGDDSTIIDSEECKLKYADSECNSSVATITTRGQCGPDLGKD